METTLDLNVQYVNVSLRLISKLLKTKSSLCVAAGIDQQTKATVHKE